MKMVEDIVEIFWRDRGLFLASNAFFFGLILLGAVVALLFPGLQDATLENIDRILSSEVLSGVEQAYRSGNVLHAATLTFLYNFLVATVATVIVPSLIFPPWALLIFGLRSLMVGVALIVPYGSLTIGRVIPHYLTILIEGEAYAVVIFAVMRQVEALVWPVQFGERSRLKAYLRAVGDSLKLLLVVAALLAIAALYEAWEVMYFAGIIK